jgi:diaminohydroxyphosphoribosylaminopyrimidine deaminase / 5-amino-6-(5-phosphoribosylamino)uracil reductase
MRRRQPLENRNTGLARAPMAMTDPLDLIRTASREKPFVVAQLGQSLDGRIATPSGESRWINKECALDHVHGIRAAVDAVIVGIGTVVADDPLLNVRRTPGRNPARVVIDPSGRISTAARCLADDGSRRIVIRAEGPAAASVLPSGVEVIRLAREDGALAPHAIIDALWRTGLRSFLVEGGATTISRFIDEGAIDRLHVLVAPVILGSGKPGLSLKPIARLAEALRPAAGVHVLADGDVLFDCDLRSRNTGT